MWGFQAAKKRNQQQILERVPHSQLSSQLRIWEELLYPPASFCKWNICVIISLYLIASSSDSWFLADGDLGKLRVRSSTPVGVEHHCESDSLCMDPVAPGTGKDLGWGWLGGCLLLPPAALFCSFCASQSQSYNWPFSLTSTNHLSLRPAAAKIDGWFLPVQAAPSVGLCSTFLVYHNYTFLLRPGFLQH